MLVTFATALLNAQGAAVRRLARIAPLFLGGPGASSAFIGQLRVRRLDGDLIEAAHRPAAIPNE